MHGTALTRTQRPRRTSARHHRARALKNRLSRHRATRRGTHSPGSCARRSTRLCNRRNRSGRRSFVHRTRSGLRNDHARRWRLRARNCRRCSRAQRGERSLRRSRCGHRRRCRHNHSGRSRGTRRCRYWRRNWSLAWRHCGRRPLHNGSGHCGPRSWRRRRNCRRRNRGRGGRRRWSGHRRRSHRSRHHCRRSGWARTRRRHYFFLLRDGFQHISRTGDVRQIDLGLDFFFAAQRTRGPRRRRLRFG